MVNLSRRFAAVAPALIRRLSTEATTAVPPRKHSDRLYRRLSALGRNAGMVSSTINEYIREGRTVTKAELERCVNELRKYKRHGDALEIMEWMELRKYNFKYGNHAVNLDLIAKVKGIAAAEEYFNSLSSTKKVHCVYGALLSCYCNEKMTDKALAIFDTMVRENMITRALTFNSLMSLYGGLGQHQKVLDLGEKLKKGPIKPDTCTYNLLMKAYASLNDINGVEGVFEEMQLRNREECNWTSYTTLANIYIKAGYQVKANVALQKVERKMDKNDRDAYHFLISLYAAASNLHQVHRIWRTLKSTLAIVTNRSYLVALQAFGNLGDIEGMTECYKEWECVCSSYDVRLSDAVIRAYLRHDKVEEAKTVLEVAMVRSTGPFFYVWEQFMNFYVSKNQIKLALQIMEMATSEADKIEWHPRYVEDKFLAYFKQGSDVHSAEEFYKMMKRLNCIDGRVYEALLETYKAAGETKLDMHARIKGDGVEINSEIERLLASVCPMQAGAVMVGLTNSLQPSHDNLGIPSTIL